MMKKKPIKTFTETFTDECCNEDTCACNCHTSDDDYMLEKLYDMKNDIDFMIQVLEHRKEKEQTYQDILSYEDDEEEEQENIDVQKLLEELNYIIKQSKSRTIIPNPYTDISPYTHTINPNKWRVYF